MEQKLIFLDIDGTILGYDGTLPASAVTAFTSIQVAVRLSYLRNC